MEAVLEEEQGPGEGRLPVRWKWIVAEGSPFSLAETGFEGTRTSLMKRHVALIRQEIVTPAECGEPESKARNGGD